MRTMIHVLAATAAALLMAACGGGSDVCYYGPGSTKCSTESTTSTVATVEVLASAIELDSGGEQIAVSAIVKDSGNASIAAAPVVFSVDTGTLTGAASVTDATGLATANLSSGADKSNRLVTITVTSGAVTGTLSLPVTGTSLTYSGVTTLGLGKSAAVSVKANDGKGNPISGLSIAVTSKLNNGLSSSAVTTDSQGTASVTYTATNAGADTLTFSGAGSEASATIQISAEDFVFTGPKPGTLIPVGLSRAVTVRYLAGGMPQVGAKVNFAATAGIVSPTSALTDAKGEASVQIVSATASPATIQATLVSAAVTAQATVDIEFVAQTPAALVLQVSPAAIGPNLSGSSVQQAQLIAAVRDANGNPVKGATVNFNRIVDPSGGNLSQASALTDSSGLASVQYVAGPLTTASNGVQIRATVAGLASVFGDAMLTVNQSALFIALGTGNVIENLDPQTYKKDWVVMVTDANGVAVPDVNLTLKVLPVEYGKGNLVWSGTVWTYAAGVRFCPSEDTNFNGVLDAGEDANGNGVLEPGNVISVSPGTVKTDTDGRATISLIYAESYAPWVEVRLRAEAVVTGTESSKEAVFVVSGASEDFTVQTVPPAGAQSPFGRNACGVAD